MRIVQIILPSASEYERKSQRIDRGALAERHEIVLCDSLASLTAAGTGADVAHVYASGELPRTTRIDVPYVSSAPRARSRWPWRKANEPRAIVTWENVPEAVEDAYFDSRPAGGWREKKVIGSFARSSITNVVEQTLSRIHRFRDDVTWHLFHHVPTPKDLDGVDVWVDPAIEDGDLDGFTAEALAVGLPVVAARTAINSARLEKGRTGWLVPPRDPNEMTHAILAALFKPEVAESKIRAARQTVSKFRVRQRLRALLPLYESLIR